MKATEKKSITGKLISCLIVAIIFGGIAALVAVADIAPGSGIMATLFVAFLGAIIAVQLIPGMMLLGMMLKGVASLFRKAEAHNEIK